MAGRSLALAALLTALPATATASASTMDADRFAQFARHAHASGTIEMTLRFEGVKEAGCEAAGTCGVKGKVTTTMTLDSRRRVQSPAAGLVVLPGKGSIVASITGPKCRDRMRFSTAGVAYEPADDGILLRPGAVVDGATAQDPFATHCAGPTLLALGSGRALPAVTLKSVPEGVSVVRLSFADRRQEFTAAGYDGSVTVRAKVRLRDA